MRKPKKKTQKLWSPDEAKWLDENYLLLGAPDCAKILGRTVSSIKGAVTHFGIKGKQVCWTKKQVIWLSENYKLLGCGECARLLGKTESAIKRAACRHGIMAKRRLWIQEEDAAILDAYPEEGSKFLVEEIGRSARSIRLRCYSLGVRKKPDPVIAEARKLYYRGFSDVCISRNLGKIRNWFTKLRRGPPRNPCGCPDCNAKRAGVKTRKITDENDLDFDGNLVTM